MHWLYLNVPILWCCLGSVTFALTLDFCYKYINMYITLKKFGNMHTNDDKNQDMSQIPKININTIMKLTVANFLQIYIT
jgi:hypothetical protein